MFLHGARIVRLRRFPYVVVYLDLTETVQVIAVAHSKRRPNYWRKRLT